jgi:ribonuclease R
MKKKSKKFKQGHQRKKIQPKKISSRFEMEGKIIGTGKSYAFFEPDDKSGDLFIGEDDLRGAIHGDRVLVRKISQDKGNGEGRVLKIIERTKEFFVGTIRNGYCLPIERGMPKSIAIIPSESVEYEEGDRVYARLLPDPAFCIIVERMGKQGITDVDILSIIRSYPLPERFPQHVLDFASTLPSKVLGEEKEGREDFTGDLVITIDGEHSKDFDDAICVRKNEYGYELDVHIADVGHYVKTDGKIDKEALKRATSVYFADRVIPMLPESLSNGICSLNEGVERLTLSVLMKIDGEGNVYDSKICEGVIKSKARMTYEKVAKILDGDEELCRIYAFLIPMLKDANDLASILNKKRLAKGSVEFDITETEFDFDKDKNVVGIHPLKRLVSHGIIEEFMLMANETVARKFAIMKAPFVYRVHETPPPEKVTALNEFLQSLGVKFVQEPQPEDYSRLLSETEDNLKGVVSRVALRSMSKADYRPDCKGHFGLAKKFYCHFTSPIRRYPDLAIHRIIKDFLHGKSLNAYKDRVKTYSQISSEREKIAEEAERKVDDLLKAKFMADKIGNEYDGTVSGVTDRGVFVELDNSVEGMVKAENMQGNFTYNEKLMTLSCGSVRYRIGDRVRIKVESIDGDKIAFTFVKSE